MYNTRTQPLIIFSLLVIIQFACSRKQIANNTSTHTEVFLIQNKKENLIKDRQTINLDKAEFAIEYFNKKYQPDQNIFHAALVAFSLDEGDFSNYTKGDFIKENPYFKPGTGMAPSYNGFYESIFIENDANCYLTYQNESKRRVNLIKEFNNGFLRLNFPVKKFHIGGESIEIKNTTFDKIHVAILIDWNLNQIIDSDELTRFTINFENKKR